MTVDLVARTRALLKRAEGRGWIVESERAIPYGRTARLVRGAEAAVLNTYAGKRGFRIVAAGKASDALRADLELADAPARPRASASRDPFGGDLPRIGGDESGKGDWFGPLVVAVVGSDEATLDAVLKIGVADSKRLSDPQVLRMAGQLDRLGVGCVRMLMPIAYNEAYAELPNINGLLAGLYRDATAELMAARPWAPKSVVIDRFTTRVARLREVMGLPPAVRLICEARGEADPLVAAASILARAAFVDGLRTLGQELGSTLPPGAGKPVLQAGRALAKTMGPSVFPSIAKMHFATTRQVLGS